MAMEGEKVVNVWEERILEVIAEEARAKIKEEIEVRAQEACEEVDYLVASALRHLPPEIRAMPARSVIQLLDGEPIQAAPAASSAASSSNAPASATTALPPSRVADLRRLFDRRHRPGPGACPVR
ncbi:unnamed protein product [Durusdinium trenchii]|uniref:Uncharacterized protein n=2 Tax=Durusdinium trenchii TaxID=1381693 RepID=A0ABP0IMJ5_9DINO